MSRVWKDRIVEHPRRYKDQNGNTLVLTPDSGIVIEEGTPVNAMNLNGIEQDITEHVSMINANTNSIGVVDQKVDAHLADTMSYSTYKTLPDADGIFTQLEYKRADGSLIMKSVLSGGTSPEYTTRTETEYAQNGVDVVNTKVYSITYTDGKVTSEVLQ